MSPWPVHPPPDVALLRGSPRRLRFWAVGLTLVGLAPVLGAFVYGYHDWPAFWSAGATAGSADLVDEVRHLDWQRAHGLPESFFAYPAGAAWIFAPFAWLPIGIGFVVHGLLMLGAAIAAGYAAAPIFGLERRTSVLAVIAFGPVTASVTLGQNGPLALLLAVVAIAGLVRGNTFAAAVGIGLLLYKPTLAAPFIGLLILRRKWSELAIVAAIGAGWYVAGVLAAGADWQWPLVWLDGLRGYLDADFAGNADKAISLPGLAARLPVPGWVPLLLGAAVVLCAAPRLVRAPMLEAGCAAALVGVAVSPHAWGYDAALVVPFLLWMISGRGPLTEPARTRLLVAAYVVGPLWLVSRQTIVSSVAVLVLALLAVWLWGAWMRPQGESAAR